MQQVPPKTKKVSVQQFHTYCVQWDNENKSPLTIKLAKGTAQSLGAEIMPLQPVTIQPGTIMPIYTWQGCDLEFESQQEFTTELGMDLTVLHDGTRDNPMYFYMDLHYKLTVARRLALENAVLGPRIMILGEQKPEKLDICKLLVNYAAKLNMEPIFVDLDLQNLAFCDGCISATHIKSRMPLNFIEYSNKVVFYYGGTKIHKKTYITQMQSLAKNTLQKLNNELKIFKQKSLSEQYPPFCSGLIIHVPSLKGIQGATQKELVQEIIKQFDITHALILEDVNMLAFLNKQYPKIERSSVPKLENIRDEGEKPNKVEIYFNGSAGQSIYKRKLILKLSDIKTYEVKVGEDDNPYCILLDLSQMEIVKSVITILHAKNEINDDPFTLANKALTSPVCCLAKIHNIQNGDVVLYVIEQDFLQLHKNSLWVLGRVSP